MLRRISKISFGAALGLFVVAQFFQPTRANPAAGPDSSFAAVARPPAEVVSIVKRSCGDCHSNDTVWPWYSHVSPASWLVAQDVQEGRVHLNFSEWRQFGPEMARSRIREACEQVRDRKMPPWYYLPLHPAATLSQADIGTLCTVRWSGDGTSLAGSRMLVRKAGQLAVLEQPYPHLVRAVPR
jgi:heme-binding protein